MMTSRAVLEVLERLRQAGIAVWLDGGWGVDALIGEQTRQHDDLDCIVALAAAPAAQTALAPLGFVVTEDEQPTRFVARDGRDRRVDFHTVTFDADGGGVQHLQDGSPWRFPPNALAGVGRIAGQSVPCLSAQVQALAHVGYEPDDKDFHDMTLLAERFEIDLPAPYRETP